MNDKMKNILSIVVTVLIGGVIGAGVLCLFGYIVSFFVETPLKDVFFMTGLIVTVIGCFASMRATGAGFGMDSGVGASRFLFSKKQDNEERDLHEDFLKSRIADPTTLSLQILFSGIVVLLFGF